MVKKRNLAKGAAAFGAAMAAMNAAPELHADIVQLNVNPGTVIYTGASAQGPMTLSTLGGPIGVSFSQWNDSIGRTFLPGAGFVGWGLFANSTTINPGQTWTFTGGANFGNTATVTQFGYIGFEDTNGNVGWFTILLTPTPAASGGLSTGEIFYFGGPNSGYGNLGEGVHVGFNIPEPSSALGLLAMGAAGLCRRRKRA